MRHAVFALCLCLLPARAFADGCTADTDCKAGRVCVQGACQDPQGGCSADRDCPGDQVCEGRRCIDRGVLAPPPPAPPAEPATPPNWVAPRAIRHTGPGVAWELYAAGGLHSREFSDFGDAGDGLGWVVGGAAGMRMGGGTGLVAIGGYAQAKNNRCSSMGGCTMPTEMRLAHLGLGASFRTHAGSTTVGLAWASSPGTDKSGGALVFRYLYALADRFGIVFDTCLALLEDDRATTFSLGVGWAE